MYETDNEEKTSSQNKSFNCNHASELRRIKKRLLSIAKLIDYKTYVKSGRNGNDKEKSIIQHRSRICEQSSESSDSEKHFEDSEELIKYPEDDDNTPDDEPEYSNPELDWFIHF